jgi:D-2-hydroxyacid dehydrogenase (NADP+)
LTGLLLSRGFVADFGGQLDDIARRCQLDLDIVHLPDDPQARLSQADCDRIEIANFTRDWRFGKHYDSFTDAVLAAKNLKWVQFISAAVDQFPFAPSLLKRGVGLVTAAGTNSEPVALNAITGLMMLARKFPFYLDAQRRRAWEPLRGDRIPDDLRGQTVVVVGTGAIGMSVARFCRALGMQVIGVRRSPRRADEPLDEIHPPARFADLLPRCQWLVLACPYSKETHHLLNARTLGALPRGAGIINVSRGALIDEPALVDALKSGQIGGAYLDVFEQEPLPAPSPLWDLPNVIVTPHGAAFSTGNERRSSELFLAHLEQWARGEPLRNEIRA